MYRQSGRGPVRRSLQVEALEPRQLLAAVAANDHFVVNAGRTLNVDGSSTGYSGGELIEVATFVSPVNVQQIEYSSQFDLLFLRDSYLTHIVNSKTGQLVSTLRARGLFTDLDLSPDGRYLFTADSGDLSAETYIYRFDLAAAEWQMKASPRVTYRLEAVDSERVVTWERFQTTISLSRFGDVRTSPMVEVANTFGASHGDIEFDHRTNRLYSGSSDSAGQIYSREIVAGNFIQRRESGSYGSVEGFDRGPITLSSDGKRVYLGTLQVEPEDVSNHLRAFPEVIHAATTRIAFGANGYYDAETGEHLGSLGFATQTYFVSDDSSEMWAFDAAEGKLHHYRFADSRSGVLANDHGAGPLEAALVTSPEHGEILFRTDGSFTYIPQTGFTEEDQFVYRVRDSGGFESTAEVRITVQPTGHSPQPANDDISTLAGQPLVVDASVSYDLPELVEVSQFRSSGNARKLVYSESAELLVLLNDTTLRVVDVRTEREVFAHTPSHTFRDMDLSPDGRYLYVADHGNSIANSGIPFSPHHVHRLDLQSLTWETKLSVLGAWRIEAVDDHRFLLLQTEEPTNLVLIDFGYDSAQPTSELSRLSAPHGDIEFDPATGLILQGTIWSSSREIHASRIIGNTLVTVGDTGDYGTAHVGGSTSALSSDGSHFYYGALQVDASNVRTNLHLFPEPILAASDRIAFGQFAYYDAQTGEPRGHWGFTPSLLSVSAGGTHVWAFNPDADVLHHYRIVPSNRTGLLVNDRDADGDSLTSKLEGDAQNGNVTLNQDGTFTYVPDDGFIGLDTFSYSTTDATGKQSIAQVTINVVAPPTVNVAPQPTDDIYVAAANQTLVIGGRPWLDVANHEILSFDTAVTVEQVEYSPQFDLAIVRTFAQAIVFRGSTGEFVSQVDARNSLTDMDLTFDGRYLFVADGGGPNGGYQERPSQAYVHRYDLATQTWDIQPLPTSVLRIEAVDRNHLLLLEWGSHVDITYHHFSDWRGAPISELSRIPARYSGNFEFDPRTGFVYYGGSSDQIVTRQLVDGTLVAGTEVQIYGIAHQFGGRTVLSADGKRFYYGRLQINAQDVRQNLRLFAEPIYAATAQVAFGKTAYYDARTGARLGDVGFESTAWFVSDDGGHVWAADSTGRLHHFDIRLPRAGVLLNDVDANGNDLQVDSYSQPSHGSVTVEPSGAFLYTPTAGYVGADEFTYRVIDSRGAQAIATVRVDVQVEAGPTLELRLDRFTVSERIAGASIGQLSVSGAELGAEFAFSVSDSRFEIVDGALGLKADTILNATIESSIPLTITATLDDGPSVSQQFQVTVIANALPWHNPQLPSDVDNDGVIIPLDALLIINELNSRGPRELDWAVANQSLRFLDTSGDGYVSAIDALIVINFLNRDLAGDGEASVSADRPAGRTPGVVTSQHALVDEAIAWYLLDQPTRSRKIRSGVS